MFIIGNINCWKVLRGVLGCGDKLDNELRKINISAAYKAAKYIFVSFKKNEICRPFLCENPNH